MRKLSNIIVILLAIVSISLAQTQLEMNKTANDDYGKADKKLNVVYQKILKMYKDNDIFIKNLKTAQKIWVQFRDAQLAVKFPPQRGSNFYGSVQPMCQASYLAQLTEQRTKELEEWLKKLDDGDACSGTIGEYEK